MNNNIFNQQQAQQNGFYPYPYPAGMAAQVRPETPSYMMPQPAVPVFLRGRPVASFEEARVAQIDLDGSVFIFPDLGNKKIYTKRINADGTATLNSYSLDVKPVEQETVYATKNDFQELKDILDGIVSKLQGSGKPTPSGEKEVKLNF